MTQREETLLFFDKYFKEIGLDYMIFASSLLGVVREGAIMPKDPEIDVCVKGEDLTPELLKIIKSSGFYAGSYECKEAVGEIYLNQNGTNVGQSENGWVAISPMWLKKDICYINMTGDECIVMDKKNYDKKNWQKLNYLGQEFNCPPDPEKWLESWYGKDWETPLETNWQNNVNRRKWSEINE